MMFISITTVRKRAKGINLKINAGETVAFVGPSGAGKTTICSLIPRFYDVNEGAISIDGIGYSRYDDNNPYVRKLELCNKMCFLFTGTIRENIAYGNLHASDEEIYEAARKAHLEDMIAALPRWL